MPIARVQMPDGRIARIEVPDGTTSQQVEAFVLESSNGTRKAPLDAIEKSALEAQKPTALERFGRGFSDITQGVKQGYLMAKDALTSPSMSDMVTGDRESDRYSREKSQELARYEKGRGPDAGVDWMRMGGNVVATAPTLIIPGAGASSLGMRALSGAAQGAVSSGAMFTPEGESKLTQTLLGAGIGAAVPVAVQAVKQAVQKAATSALPTGGTISLPNLRGQIEIELRQQGIDFNKLTSTVQQSLLADAQNVLKTNMQLDPTQLARKADIEAVGAKGTKAAVTRNPRDWRTMQNLRGVDDVGEGIAARQSGDAQAMTGYLSRLRQGAATTPLEAGESTIGALRWQDAVIKSGVDKAYGAARDNLGRASPMDAKAFSDAANLALDDQMLGAYLPGQVRTILNDVSAGKIPFNVNTAVQMDSVLSAAQRSAGRGSPEALAIGKVRDALNSAPIADNVGQDAKRAFDTARAAARGRFALHEQVPAMAAAIDEAAPDRFVKKFVLDADAGTLRDTLRQLRSTPDGAAAVADIKGTVIDNLLMKATGATSVEDLAARPFSGRNFAKALDAIPHEKLHAIFTPDELNSLRTLQRASKYLTEEVPFSDVNHSKTAAAMANLLAKIGQTPILGGLLSPILGTAKIGVDWVKDAAQRKAVAEILLTTAGRPAQTVPAQLAAPGKLAPLGPGAAAAILTSPRDQQTDR